MLMFTKTVYQILLFMLKTHEAERLREPSMAFYIEMFCWPTLERIIILK